MFAYKSRSNSGCLKTLRYRPEAEELFRLYGIKKPKNEYDKIIDFLYHDPAKRSVQRSWKAHRKTQYKQG